VAESVSVFSVGAQGPPCSWRYSSYQLEELKYLFRQGTGSRARGPQRSESLNSVELPGRPEAGVAPMAPGRREAHLKTGVAQWWG
jgi:hypothetical protein